MRYVIHNGRICDGSGSPSYDGDILIEDGRIEKIVHREEEREGLGRGLDGVHIDAEGKVITPGFIDTHRHCYAMRTLGRWNFPRALPVWPGGTAV